MASFNRLKKIQDTLPVGLTSLRGFDPAKVPGGFHRSTGKGALKQSITGEPPPTDPNDYQRWFELFPEIQTSLDVAGAGGAPSQQIYDVLRAQRAGADPRDTFGFMAPQLAASLGGMPATDFLMDFRNVQNPMQAFGQGAGMIGQGAQRALQQSQQELGRAGLGRSGAMAGLSQRAAQGAATQQAGLFTDLYQATQQRQMESALRAFDLQRQIAQMALGQSMLPRDAGDGGGGGTASMIAGGVGAAGQLMGGLGALLAL